MCAHARGSWISLLLGLDWGRRLQGAGGVVLVILHAMSLTTIYLLTLHACNALGGAMRFSQARAVFQKDDDKHAPAAAAITI